MAKDTHTMTIMTVRDPTSGQFVTVKGAGALKGKMKISKKVDLTKPISVPTPGGKWTPAGNRLAVGTPSENNSADRNAAKR